MHLGIKSKGLYFDVFIRLDEEGGVGGREKLKGIVRGVSLEVRVGDIF